MSWLDRLGSRAAASNVADGDADDTATIVSGGGDAWLLDAEYKQRCDHGAGLVPTCLSCRRHAPWRLTEKGGTMTQELSKRGMLEWCSKCIQHTAVGRNLFDEGQLFGPAATGYGLRLEVNERQAEQKQAAGKEPEFPKPRKKEPFVPRAESLAKKILEDSWQVDDSRTLTIAAGRGSLVEVKSLLQNIGNGLFDIDLEFRDPSGCSPLMCAAAKGHADVCAALLEAGANIETVDSFGYCPLHRAAMSNHAAVITVLTYKHKGWAAAQLDRVVDTGSSGDHWTAFHFACARGHTESAQALLKAGCNPELLVRGPLMAASNRLDYLLS